LALLFRQLANGHLQFVQLTRTGRIGRRDDGPGALVDIDRKIVARSAPHFVDILVVHNRKHPRAQIAAGLPQMLLP
jgi:hypothetical protein